MKPHITGTVLETRVLIVRRSVLTSHARLTLVVSALTRVCLIACNVSQAEVMAPAPCRNDIGQSAHDVAAARS